MVELAAAHEVTMPIGAEVDMVVNEGRHPAEAYRGLMRTVAESELHEGV